MDDVSAYFLNDTIIYSRSSIVGDSVKGNEANRTRVDHRFFNVCAYVNGRNRAGDCYRCFRYYGKTGWCSASKRCAIGCGVLYLCTLIGSLYSIRLSSFKTNEEGS